MKMTRASHYALTALAHLAAQKDNKVTASHVIASGQGVPERFLLKVLKPLVALGVLHSVKGPGGGYRLTRAPKDITLLEVIEAVDGPIRADVPQFGKGGDTVHGRLEKVCDEATKVTRERLDKVTLASLVGKG
jgi:Rrf2 family protein